MSRRRGKVETRDYFMAAKRFIRGFGSRVGDGDPEDLADLLSLRADVERAILTGIDGLASQGHSYATMAAPTGRSRQNLQILHKRLRDTYTE